MKNHFFAMLSRMRYINRWALMRNTRAENISEHSHETAAVAHALVLIQNKRFGGNLNGERAALLGIYHDMPEILTGDLPTPVKYYNPEIKEAYNKVEDTACEKILGMLPDDLRDDYRPFFFKEEQDSELWKYVKAADKISALIKCVEEEKAGNREFSSARDTILKAIREMNLPAADVFLEEFLPSYFLTLDEQQGL